MGLATPQGLCPCKFACCYFLLLLENLMNPILFFTKTEMEVGKQFEILSNKKRDSSNINMTRQKQTLAITVFYREMFRVHQK